MAPTLRVTPRELDILITGFGPFMSVGSNPSWLAVKPLHNTVLDLDSTPSLATAATTDDAQVNNDGEGVKARIQTMQVPVHYGSVLDVVPRIHGCSSPPSPGAHFWYDSRLDPEFGGTPSGVYPTAYPVEPPALKAWDVVIHVGVGRQGSLRCETQAHKLGYGKPDANAQWAPLAYSASTATSIVAPKHLDKDGAVRGFAAGYEAFGELESTPIPVSELISWLKARGLQTEEVDQSFDPGRYLCDFIFYCSLCEAKRNQAGTLVLFVHVPPAGERLEVERCTQAIRAIAWFMANKRSVTARARDATTTVVSGFDAPTAAPRTRPTSKQQQQQQKQPQRASTVGAQQQRSAQYNASSRSSTTTSSAPSSRRSSLVLDPSAYRYSLNVGGISRFPASLNGAASGGAGGTNGANQILRASRAAAAAASRVDAGASAGDVGASIDPSRASVSSTGSSRASSSRLSSRYTAEEVAPQRRPVYLTLPSDPSALGPWSNTSSTLLAPSKNNKDASNKPSNKGGEADGGGGGGGRPPEGRRNSKIMTSFPFPHPVTPRRRGDGAGGGDTSASSGGRVGLGAAWQRLLNAIFAGPYERQLNREEVEDDRITQSIIRDIARRNGSPAATPSSSTAVPATKNATSYGTIPIPSATTTTNAAGGGSPTSDPDDPYGYRQLAGPHLLPSYTTDLVARRRERRRARSRARFQCMALWTIWTVSIVLVLIVAVLVFSFVFPDKLDIPNRSDDEDEDGDQLAGMAALVGVRMANVWAGVAWNAVSTRWLEVGK
ncbi:hypothetical protein EX895_003337 [Sporisorium graminicola]|uniref:Peptidase C15, pyroglutamyl peptidase I-like protein n=1 Tax=Sporisorium graminicola TaxID=280036 RepID=A0A4U7KUE5_9BASI|nr:hypothetical protein EX895_003337 [Sporisorium graminicola]TKY87756.1 hypothetical protein EX895_003337 [Sporisorium graminicola]